MTRITSSCKVSKRRKVTQGTFLALQWLAEQGYTADAALEKFFWLGQSPKETRALRFLVKHGWGDMPLVESLSEIEVRGPATKQQTP